jgi:hypothetical protein
MNDPQNLGLGELGKRMQAMSDPAPDSRLRPYQSAQPPTISASNGHTGTPLEPYEDLRNAPPPSPVPYPQQPVLSPAPTQESSVNLAAPSREPVSPWETVPTPASAPSPAPPTQQQSLPPGPQPAVPVAADAHKSGLHRALDAFRSTIPLVQKLLPLIDGNFATAVGALMAPHAHPSPPPQPQAQTKPQVVHIDMEPIERGLAEVRNSHRELRGQVQEQVTTLKRVEDHLERVREATDRNTLEQQELVEDLRSVGSRLTTFAIVGVVLLVASLVLNGYLIFQLQHILH